MAPGKVKQACDCCRARKIRCNGNDPCANCTEAALRCTYLAVHKKTGPKGPRRSRTAGHPVDGPGLRRRIASPSSTSSAAAASPMNVAGDSPQDTSSVNTASSAGFQISPLVEIGFIALCLEAFFKYKYPITPVLHREKTEEALTDLESQPEVYGMVTACSAVIVQSPELLSSLEPSSMPAGRSGLGNLDRSALTMPTASFLISETLRARYVCNHIESPSLTTIQTSFFLFSAFFCLGQDNSAWFYLREAVTFLQLLRLDEEETYASALAGDPVLATYSRRMFWTLFVTERAYALQRHRVPTLQKSIAQPHQDSDPQAKIIPGLSALISLFAPFNNDFFALWNHSSRASTTSAELLVRLQRMLLYTLPSTSGCNESQLADLLVSREWLKIMVWQLCVSNTMLSSSSDDESMSFKYPVTIAREVILVSQIMPLKAFEANGVGILEKVFDIGCSLADVLSLKPMFMESSALEVGPRDYLTELIRIVGTTLGGSDRHVQVLMRKAAESLQTGINRPLLITEEDTYEHHQVHEIDDENEVNWLQDVGHISGSYSTWSNMAANYSAHLSGP